MFNLHFRIERWKWNSEYQLYVSSDGRLKNANRKLLKPKLNLSGYFCVRLSDDRVKNVHRIVAETFYGKQEGTVDHINGNKRDNSKRNLEWVTYEENQRRAREAREMVIDPEAEGLSKLPTQKDYITNALKTVDTESEIIIAASSAEWYDIFSTKYPNRVNGLTREKAARRILSAASQSRRYLGFHMSRSLDGTIKGVCWEDDAAAYVIF